ncbi:MAG: hypothetical protein AAGH42_10340 [Pseudomonadota bacterium]
MRQEILNWLGTLSPPDLVLATGMLLFGLVIGWLIWGGRGRYIRELEDDLAAARKQTRRVLVAAEQQDTGDDVETVLASRAMPAPVSAPVSASVSASAAEPVPPAVDSRQVAPDEAAAIRTDPGLDTGLLQPRTEDPVSAQSLSDDQDARLAALSEELARIRVLLGQSPLNTDPVKETLDQADMATKRANGRLKIIMSTPPFTDEGPKGGA